MGGDIKMSFNKVNYIDGQTVISAKNMNDIQDEVIRLGGKEAIQSDWFEANENSLAYDLIPNGRPLRRCYRGKTAGCNCKQYFFHVISVKNNQ